MNAAKIVDHLFILKIRETLGFNLKCIIFLEICKGN